MLKKLIPLFVLALFLVSCAGPTEKEAHSSNEEVSTESEVPQFSLIDFYAEAGKYVDKEVKVAGLVDHVCKHGGKKLFLVSEGSDLHVESDTRFDEDLAGSEVLVKGVVREFRVDEGYCLQIEEDNIQSHKTGETDDDFFERKINEIAFYRDSMKRAGTDHISYYSLEYVSLEEKS